MKNAKKLPSGRVTRLSQFGGLLTNVAGNMMVDGVKSLSRGEIPALKDLLLTEKNISNLAHRLAHLRGAAMKMGQLLSMDSGELLSPELNKLLAILRDDAYVLPEKQLVGVMIDNLGENWRDNFTEFDTTPFASASIGQVHKALSPEGKPLAVKVQYPGVNKSIHSDVDNMGMLMKMSGLVPENINLTRLLLEIKIQLIREADYQIEANFLNLYAQHLVDEPNFIVPEVIPQLSNELLLTMSYEHGEEIETLDRLPADDKNRFCQNLVTLLFKELFQFQLMQTDPNYANFRFRAAEQKIVLLDFGACREISTELKDAYLSIAEAILNGDVESVYEAATALGFYQKEVSKSFKQEMLATLEIIFEPIQYDGEYDFAASNVLARLRERAMNHTQYRHYFGTPNAEAIFIHRKIAGIFLLLIRVNAKLNLNKILRTFL